MQCHATTIFVYATIITNDHNSYGELMRIGAKNKQERSNKILVVAVGVLLLAAIATAGFFAKQYFDLRNNAGAGGSSQESAQAITDKVRKLIILPNETPAIAEIKDKTKLTQQAFFANAENGDQLLIYAKSRKAYIYREKDNILVNVDSVDIGDNKAATDATKK